MRYVIYATFDSNTEAALYHLQVQLAESVEGIKSPIGKMRPHLSLMVCDAKDDAWMCERFLEWAAQAQRFSLTLKGVASFSGKKHVIYVEPVRNVALERSYLQCAKHMKEAHIVPSYVKLERFIPHITLAKGMEDKAFLEAMQMAEKLFETREAIVQAVGLIQARKPLAVLAERVF